MYPIRSIKKHKANANKYKGEINCSTIIVGDFKTPFPSMERSYGQKINKEIK